MAQQVYDLSQLEELAGGSTEFVDSMIGTFLEHTPDQLSAIINAYESGDLATVGSLAHKIKPNIDLFGISDIKDEIRVVEAKGKSGINDDELKLCIQKVQKYLEISFNQLRER